MNLPAINRHPPPPTPTPYPPEPSRSIPPLTPLTPHPPNTMRVIEVASNVPRAGALPPQQLQGHRQRAPFCDLFLAARPSSGGRPAADGHVPAPFGPTTAWKFLKGPTICVPLYDLKLVSSMWWMEPCTPRAGRAFLSDDGEKPGRAAAATASSGDSDAA